MRLLIPLAALVVVSCGGSESTPTGPAPVASISLSDGPAISLVTGATRALTATPRDAAGNALSGRTVAWSSSANGVATVSSLGVVTAIGAGSAQIRATSEGKTAELTVTVAAVASVASVTIAGGPTLSLVAGSARQLTATTRDASGNTLTGRMVLWSSSSNAIASVSSDGLVSAVSAGVTQIRASSEAASSEITVTVTASPWTQTGSLSTGRTLHSATLLADGRVLVVGGQTLGPPFQTFASAELYNPTTGTWSITGSLATGRENHFALRLQNGRVLVGGGRSIEQSTALSSVELYDPTTGVWTATGSMSVARDLPTVAMLADGRVLVSGGLGAGAGAQALSSAEIYNPATGTWTAAGAMTAARASHTAVRLANGRILVAGGASGTVVSSQPLSSAELFDPVTSTWTPTGGFSTPRGFHQAVLLANGQALITGGSNWIATVYSASDRFDPATGTWTPTGSLASARISHTATVLPNGKVVVVGGGGNSSTPFASVEVYDPATGAWTAASDLRVARSNHAAVLLSNGKVLVIGGQGTGASTSAEIFDPAAGAP
jgi:N-acetylneuraminic acid mutarotase